MFIYALIIGLIALAELGFTERQDLRRDLCFRFLFILITLMVGLRAPSVGPDTAGYMGQFCLYGSLPFGECLSKAVHFEYGYQLLIWVVFRLIPNATAFLLICAALCFRCVYRWIVQNCEDRLFALYIFFCVYITFFMTGLRQCLAMSVLLLSYKYLRTLNLIRFTLCVLLAGQFHATAYFFLLAYPLSLVRRKARPMQVAMFACLPLVYHFRVKLFTITSVFIYRLLPGFSHYGIAAVKDNIYYTAFLYLVALFVILFSGADQDAEGSAATIPCYGNLFLFGCLLLPFSALNGSFNRIPMVYCMYMCVLLPNVIERMKSQLLQMASKIALHIVLAVMLLGNVYQSVYSYTLVGLH